MEHLYLIELTVIAVTGTTAQWLAWKVRLPSILLLVGTGLALGPGLGIIHPDRLFGPLLLPAISLSVAIILFEGGLKLKYSELIEVGRELFMLVSVGMLITWFGASALAYWVLGFGLPASILLGSLLVVTGPTVVIPLLRHMRLQGKLGSLLKWEGIVIDPIGATLAVLVFEAVSSHPETSVGSLTALAILKTLAIGLLLGGGGTLGTVFLLRKYWIPDDLRNAVILMFLFAIFTSANLLQDEAGLLAVTLYGIFLANQSKADVRSIVEFKEHLQVLLLSFVFVTLSSRLSRADLQAIDFRTAAFVLGLILVVRPLSVFGATAGSKLTVREKFFVSFVAPRGIVAAAVSSIFAARMAEFHFAEADSFMPITFATIIGTVIVYSFVSPMLARSFGLSRTDPRGILIIGAQNWSRELARALQSQGAEVVLVDTNWNNVAKARQEGFQCHYGSVASEKLHESLELSGLKTLLALTANDEANSLAAHSFSHILGRKNVYQLPPERLEKEFSSEVSATERLWGRLLFAHDATYSNLAKRFASGERVKVTKITGEYRYEQFAADNPSALILFKITPAGEIVPVTASEAAAPQTGSFVVAFTEPSVVREQGQVQGSAA